MYTLDKIAKTIEHIIMHLLCDEIVVLLTCPAEIRCWLRSNYVWEQVIPQLPES